MKLNAKLTTKRNPSRPCKDCQVDIEAGEQYMSVTYSDGFKEKSFGAYHEACWEKSPDNPKAKKSAT